MASLTAKQRSAKSKKAYATRRKNGNTPADRIAASKVTVEHDLKVDEAAGVPRPQVGPTIVRGRGETSVDVSAQGHVSLEASQTAPRFGSYISDMPETGFKALTPALTLPKKVIWPTQREAMHFYGNPLESTNAWAHDNLVHVPCPWALYMGEAHVPFIQIHKKCAASLAEVLAYVWAKIGKSQAEAHRLGYDVYSGSWNIRNMRGGSNISMHSYGCAIDFNAPKNAQHSHHGLFGDQSPLIEAFKAAGWEWGGDWSGNSVDPMHVQAALVHG